MTQDSSRADTVAPWQLCESSPDAAKAALHETLFTVGNGRIGVRGAHEEGACWAGTSQDAIYINGFYDTEEIRYPENSYGLARNNQFMVSVPNGKAVQWRVDGEVFDPSLGQIQNYTRTLDFKTGLLKREFVWVSPQGTRVAVTSRRLVSFERPNIYAIDFTLCPLDKEAHIVVDSSLNAQSRQLEASDDPRVGSAHTANALVRLSTERHSLEEGGGVTLTHRTKRSGLIVASSLHHSIQCANPGRVSRETCGNDDGPGERFSTTLAAGESLRLTKTCALVTSLEVVTETNATETIAAHAHQLCNKAGNDGFSALCIEQQQFLTRYWQDADVEIDGDDALQQGLRFNLLHLLQSVGRDGRTNIAAKGVTGSGYDGHYFWDTEIYVFPVMLHTQPQTARKLLEFRFNTLDAARARAREMAHPHGALFPWRTIAGEECSSYFPAGTAQFHINADIAFAVKRYWEATGDDDFMRQHGAELVFETARIWLGLGHFEQGQFEDGRTQRFCIHTVTGPDEYTALVNNNLYTNAMAQMHLGFAAEIAQWLSTNDAPTLARVTTKITLAASEPARWSKAAECMYLPYNAERGIHPQDDSFLSKPRWDVAGTPPDKHPLLLHFHSLVIYRHQVCKQADVLLALLLLSEKFTAEDKKRDFDYYEPLTTHDSSLSRCIFGIVAAEVGYHDKAYSYFVEGARADLDDHHHNSHHGVHTAAMAGAWLGVVAGFAGLRMQRSLATFAPYLPAGWTRYAFKLHLGAAQLQVEITVDGCTYRLLKGTALALVHQGTSVQLSADQPEKAFTASTC